VRAARKQTVDFQMDFQKLRDAGMVETILFLRAIRAQVLRAAREAFRGGHQEAFGFPVSEQHLREHVARMARVLASTRIAARIQVRKDAGLSASSAVKLFAEALGKVSPARAVEYLRSLPALTRKEWEAAVARQQGRAFTMAGVEQKVVLDQMKALVAESLESGLTPRQFERQAFELLRNYEVSPSRLRTVWNTNVAQALGAGRRAEFADPEVAAVIQFGLFDAMNDSYTRPGHEALDNGIAPMTWWNGEGSDFYPPLDFNCRCVVLGLTAARARKLLAGGGYKDLTEQIPAGASRRRLAA